MTSKPGSEPQTPIVGYFEGERLELIWRYAYRPEFVPLLIEYLGARPGTHILDAGCGTGFLSRLLAKALENVQVKGVDTDQKLLGLGHQMVEREKLSKNVKLSEGNAYQLPFPDETFDLVTSHTLL